jgi:TRAP-type C4-dicarboxylate transport system permease small subunit
MYVWRRALIIAVLFITAGFVYLVVQGSGEWMDRAGVTMLIALGISMCLAFMLLLRSSKGL